MNMFVRISLLHICCILLVRVAQAQSGADTVAINNTLSSTDSMPAKIHSDTAARKDAGIYNVRVKYELPAAGAFLVASYFGFPALDRTSAYSAADLGRLDPSRINGFDRPIIDMDPAGFQRAQKSSDLFLNISVLSPVLLALDKRIRKDWLDLVTLYLVTQAVDNTVYFSMAFPIRRARPLTYNTHLTVEERTGIAKSNSFFSGHVSFSATATFFLVKVYTDYHQIKGLKRLLLYGAAAVPPALVGYYRMRAGKHFKTDVLTGMLVGAACGILVPEFHRHKHKHGMALSPFYTPEYSGVSLHVPLN